MTSSLDMIRGRSNVVTLTNKSGGPLVAGDVCVIDTANDEAATTTTSAASVLKVYIAAESIADNATGKFYSAGFCPLVTPSASTTRGRYLFTHTVAKQAAESATYGAGAFGVILKSGTTPSVWLFGSTAQGSGGGVARSGATTDGHLAVWNGSSVDSLKDGGTVPAANLGAWTAYTPTWTGTVTNPVLNNGTLDGYYLISGKVMFITMRLIIGSGTTFGSGLWRWALPGGVNISLPQTLSCLVLDAGTTHRAATGTAGYSSSTTMAGYGAPAGAGNDFSPTVPQTWATSDTLLMSGTLMID